MHRADGSCLESNEDYEAWYDEHEPGWREDDPGPLSGALCSFPNCQGECKSAGSGVRAVAVAEPPADRASACDIKGCAVCGSRHHFDHVAQGAYSYRAPRFPDPPASFFSGRLLAQ